MKLMLNKVVVVFFLSIVFAIPYGIGAEKNPMRGFPAEFKASEVWEQLVIDGKPTRAYRFVANESLQDVKLKVARWLQQTEIPAMEHAKNGWTYISYRKDDSWITVQVRLFANAGSPLVEGIVSFWQDSNYRSPINFSLELSTLRNMQVLRRLESVDRGRHAISVTAIGSSSVDTVVNSLAADMKTHGFVPASYAPPLLLSDNKAANPYGAVSRAWVGNGRQILFLVFEHQGKTAAQIYVLGGKIFE
jgi:hypothetical protein